MNHDNIPINDVIGVFEKCIPKNYMPQLGKNYIFLNNVLLVLPHCHHVCHKMDLVLLQGCIVTIE